MLAKSKSFCSFSVDDLSKAKEFYGRILGLKVTDGAMGTLLLHAPGVRPIVIFPKPNHSPASFTILNFTVENIEDTVQQLAGRGVQLEHYEGDLKTDEQGIFRGDGPLIAWFKDPAGNILSIIENNNS